MKKDVKQVHYASPILTYCGRKGKLKATWIESEVTCKQCRKEIKQFGAIK
jgi:hypothetical protein